MFDMHKRTCKVCNIEFMAKTTRRVYCSKRCTDMGKPSAQGLNCYICGGRMAVGGTSSPDGKSAHNKCRAAQHGSPGTYKNGCRCAACKAGATLRMNEWRARRRLVDGVDPITQARRLARGVDPLSVATCVTCGAVVGNLRSVAPMCGPCRDDARSGHRPYISRKVRFEIYERDQWICQICGVDIDRNLPPLDKGAATLDHIVPQSLSDEPDHSPNNLRLACRSCNSSRGNRVEFDDAFIEEVTA